MKQITCLLNLHVDERFSLAEDFRLMFAEPLLLVPLILVVLVDLVTSWVLSFYATGIDFFFLLYLSPLTIVFFIKRVLLPIVFIYLLRRTLLEYEDSKPKHLLTGLGRYFLPALLYLGFFWMSLQLLQVANNFVNVIPGEISSPAGILFNDFLAVFFNVLLVAVVMGEGSSLAFIRGGFGFFFRNLTVFILAWLVLSGLRMYVLNVFTVTLPDYLFILIAVLVYLRSNPKVIEARSLNKFAKD